MRQNIFHYGVRCGAAGILLALAGCGAPDLEPRSYVEIHVPPPPTPEPDPHGPMTSMPMADPHGLLPPVSSSSSSAAAAAPQRSASFAWNVPEGWRAEPGTGMRLATLWIEADGQKGECSLIVLGGDSGGLDANIRRWMGQVNLNPAEPQVRAFMDAIPRFETEAGLTGLLIDFGPLVTDPSGLSTLASIIENGHETLFVKLTGPAKLLADHRDSFMQLSLSVRPD
jgi:hypothetical protein